MHATDILQFLGALGGAAVFSVSVWAAIRALLRLVNSIEDNTKTTAENTESIDKLKDKVEALNVTVQLQGQQISFNGTELAKQGDLLADQGKELVQIKTAINGKHL